MDEWPLNGRGTRGGRGRKDRCLWLPEDVKIMIHRGYYVLVRVIRADPAGILPRLKEKTV